VANDNRSSIKDRNRIVVGAGLVGAGAGFGNAAWRITRGTDERGTFKQVRDLYLDAWNRTFRKSDLVGQGAREVSAAMVGYRSTGLSQSRETERAAKELFLSPVDMGNNLINKAAFSEAVRTTPGLSSRAADLMQEFQAGYEKASTALEKSSFVGQLAQKHGLTGQVEKNIKKLRSVEGSLAEHQIWPEAVMGHTLQKYSDAELELQGKRYALFQGQFIDYAASPMLGSQKKMRGIRAKVAQETYNRSILQKIQQVEKTSGQRVMIEPMLVGGSKIPMYQIRFAVGKKDLSKFGDQAAKALKGFRLNIPGTFDAPRVEGTMKNVLYSSPLIQPQRGGKMITGGEFALGSLAEQAKQIFAKPRSVGSRLTDFLKDINAVTDKGKHYLGGVDTLSSSATGRLRLQAQSVYMPWIKGLPRTTDIFGAFGSLMGSGKFSPALSPGEAAEGILMKQGLYAHSAFGSLGNVARNRPGQLIRDVIEMHPDALTAMGSSYVFGPGGIFKRQGSLYATKAGRAFEAQTGHGTRVNLNVLYAPEAAFKEWGTVAEDLIMKRGGDVNKLLTTQTFPQREYRIGLDTPLSKKVQEAMAAGEGTALSLQSGEFLGLSETGKMIRAANQPGVSQELLGVTKYPGTSKTAGFLQLHIRQRNEFLEGTKLFGIKGLSQFRKTEWFNKQADELLYLDGNKSLRKMARNQFLPEHVRQEAAALLKSRELERNAVEAISSMSLLKKDPVQLMNTLWGGMETQAGLLKQNPAMARIGSQFFAGKKRVLSEISRLGSVEEQVARSIKYAENIGMQPKHIAAFGSVLTGMELTEFSSRGYLGAQKAFWEKWAGPLGQAGVSSETLDVLGRGYMFNTGVLAPAGIAVADYTHGSRLASFEPRILSGIMSRNFGALEGEAGSDILIRDIMSNMNTFQRERAALGLSVGSVEGSLSADILSHAEKNAVKVGGKDFPIESFMEGFDKGGQWMRTPDGQLRYIPGVEEWQGMGKYQSDAQRLLSKDMRRTVEAYAKRPTTKSLEGLDEVLKSAYGQSIFGVSTANQIEGSVSKLEGALRGKHHASAYVRAFNATRDLPENRVALSAMAAEDMFGSALDFARRQSDEAKIAAINDQRRRFLAGEEIAMMVGRHPGGSPEALQPMFVSLSTRTGTHSQGFVETSQAKKLFRASDAAGQIEDMWLRSDRMLGTAFDTDGDRLNIIMATDPKAEKILHRQLVDTQAVETAANRSIKQSYLDELASRAQKAKGAISHKDLALQQTVLFRSQADVGLASSISDQIYQGASRYGTATNREAVNLIAAAVEQSTISLKKAGASEIMNPFHAKMVNAFADLQSAPSGSIASSIESYFADYLGVGSLASVKGTTLAAVDPVTGVAGAPVGMPDFSAAAQEIEESVRRFRREGGGSQVSRFASGKYKGAISELAGDMSKNRVLSMLGEPQRFAAMAGEAPISTVGKAKMAFTEATQKSIDLLRRVPYKRSVLMGAAAAALATLAISARSGQSRPPDTSVLQPGDMDRPMEPVPVSSTPQRTQIVHEGAKGGLAGRIRMRANIESGMDAHSFARSTNRSMGRSSTQYVLKDDRSKMSPHALSRKIEET